MAEWIETYRGIVKAWECDVYDHLTIAYYYEHYEDASAVALEAFAPQAGPARTTGLYVRHLRELRAGDTLHIMSAPIAAGGGALTLGHKVFDSADGGLAATVEQSVAFAAPNPVAVPSDLVPWDGPVRERRDPPAGGVKFVASGRGIVKPSEVDAAGRLSWQHLIHRFSGAGLHACNAIGMTAKYLRDNRRGYSTFELDLAIAALPGVGDHVALQSAILQVGKSSMRLYHRMVDARRGAEIATLGQFGVHFDTEARRPAPLPDALRAAADGLG
jgi:acyl-CoA thioesterase FadM